MVRWLRLLLRPPARSLPPRSSSLRPHAPPPLPRFPVLPRPGRPLNPRVFGCEGAVAGAVAVLLSLRGRPDEDGPPPLRSIMVGRFGPAPLLPVLPLPPFSSFRSFAATVRGDGVARVSSGAGRGGGGCSEGRDDAGGASSSLAITAHTSLRRCTQDFLWLCNNWVGHGASIGVRGKPHARELKCALLCLGCCIGIILVVWMRIGMCIQSAVAHI